MATLVINGRETGAGPGLSLFEYAERLGVTVPTSCRKQGKCKECLLEVVEGRHLLSVPTEAERHLKGGFRLSCQTQVAGAEGRVVCHTMRRGAMRVATSGVTRAGPLSLDPAVTREGGRILIDGQEAALSDGPIYGLAVDLGTTTVVMRLYNLETGALVADTSFENPQRFAGSEIMSRIQFDTDNPGHLLRRTLAGYMSHMIEAFPADPQSIYEVVVVGNSTMRDLFFGRSVYTIGQTPYRSITEMDLAEGRSDSTVIAETGRRSLLPVHPAARVYGGPIISGHVGADAAACMMAIGLAEETRTVAVMDIGTNTELILGNRRHIVAASCPAGPAFEGGAIACGMPALDGAIEEIAIGEDGAFRATVIGGGPAEGICGSGLVDLLSELLRTGRMNEMGRFESGESEIAIDADRQIRFTEADVNELAQAKGANVAGLRVAASAYGIEFGDIDVFYLAGGFGGHLKVEAAQRIGLIPDLSAERVVDAGNTAIEGASIALLSVSKRRALESLVRRVEHCRLETHPQFFDFFVEGCQFKPVGSLAAAGGAAQ